MRSRSFASADGAVGNGQRCRMRLQIQEYDMTVITRMIGSRRRVHVGFCNPVPWPERSSGGVGQTRNRFGLWQNSMCMCQSPDFSQLPVRLGRPFLPKPRKIMLPSELARPSARIIQVREYVGGVNAKASVRVTRI